MNSFWPNNLFHSSVSDAQSESSSNYYNGLRSARNVVDSLAQVIRDPTSAVSKLVDGSPFLSSLSPEHDPDNPETARSILRLRLQNATSFDEWRTLATRLDELEGNNTWKAEHVSPEYNYDLLHARLGQLEAARTSGDAGRILHLVRTSLTRHLGGTGNIVLYNHSHIGTKHLIERYIASTLATMKTLLEITERQHGTDVDSRELLQSILKSRQAFGRSALLLSGGGTFGMNHIGVVKCLWENKLLPRIISGASAGSIVAAVLCTITEEEMPRVLKEFCHGDLEVFTRAGVDDGLLRQVARFLTTGALFDIANMTRIMKQLLGDMTFQEAYNRTRRILNICVSSASLFELPRLLNYVTAPNVIIWSAVATSCSVPLVYTPANLLAKDPKTGLTVSWNSAPQRWIDGSVDNDLPMTRLAEMFNVNHFIVSQVNPHVVPFLAKEEGKASLASSLTETAGESGPSWLNVVAGLAKDEVMHRMHVLSELGILPNLLTKTRSVLSQKYSGDITIFPEISYNQFPKVLTNPTTEFMLQASLLGERATWPKLSRIKNHCAIELALDDAVQQLRARIAFSPSQVNLRMNTITSHTKSIKSRTRNSGGRDSTARRASNAGITRKNRSMSSSESDTQRPSLPQAQSTSKMRQTPAFDLKLDTTIGTAYVPSSSDEFDDLSWPEEANHDYDSSDISGPVNIQQPELPQPRHYMSQPATPAAIRTGVYDVYYGESYMDDAVDGGDVQPCKKRSMSTGLRWLKPPEDAR